MRYNRRSDSQPGWLEAETMALPNRSGLQSGFIFSFLPLTFWPC